MKIRISAVINLIILILYGFFTVFWGGFTLSRLLFGALYLFLFACAHSFVHELGHLLGGAFSGYRLLAFYNGPIVLCRRSDGRFALRTVKSLSFQCLMIPRGNRRFVLYNMGGVILNSILVLATVVLLIFFPSTAFLPSIIAAGLIKIISNGIPATVDGEYPNDALVISIISKSECERYNYFQHLRAYEKYFLDEPMPKLGNEHTEGFFYSKMVELINEGESSL
jgi:hypothetical protein